MEKEKTIEMRMVNGRYVSAGEVVQRKPVQRQQPRPRPSTNNLEKHFKGLLRSIVLELLK
jgi:hypothetical protein